MLQILEGLPSALLSIEAHEVHRILAQPTLIHIAGAREPALFVSVLLHGNEKTGFQAVQQLLQRHEGRTLPRSLSIFFGNVWAAKEGVRRLPDQPDFNRVWMAGTTPEHLMTHRILEHMRERGVFASVDLHNNTGVNPHYACVNRLDHRFFHLAVLFSRVVVHFIRPEGVQTSAFAELCPSVVLECGKTGEKSGVDHSREYLEACLRLADIPDQPISPRDIDLYHTVATVKVPDFCSLGFGDEASDLNLRHNLDHLNFTELPPHTLLGRYRTESEARLVVSDENGRDVGATFFDYLEGEIRTKIPIMPSMFTLDRQVVRQDCLGYLMERIEVSQIAPPLPHNS
jgi:hypothetical protein